MKNKVLGFMQRKSKTAKLLVMSMMVSMLAVCSAIGASAEGEATDLQGAFSSALSTIQSDILSFIGLALPVGLAVFGSIIAIKKGVSFVRGLLGK